MDVANVSWETDFKEVLQQTMSIAAFQVAGTLDANGLEVRLAYDHQYALVVSNGGQHVYHFWQSVLEHF